MKVGRKLATKLLNATKFVLGFEAPSATAVPTDPVDIAMLSRLAATVREATEAFETYDYARALERTEATFWWFCDDYVELVKGRAYGALGPSGAESAVSAMLRALSTLQRLLAPFMPFTTETVWRWWQEGSIHRSSWPTVDELGRLIDLNIVDHTLLDPIGEVLSQIRRAKTEAKTSQKTKVARALVTASPAALANFDFGRPDLTEAGSVLMWETIADTAADSISVAVELAEPEPQS